MSDLQRAEIERLKTELKWFRTNWLAQVEHLRAATIEECAQVAYDCCEHGADVAEAIRALKEQK